MGSFGAPGPFISVSTAMITPASRILLALFTGITLLSTAARAEPADIRLQVSSKSLGSHSQGNSRTSQREFRIMIDHRGSESFDKVTMEWTVVGRDINSRKLRIAASGKKTVAIPADTDTEVTSGPFSFSKKEGKVERTRKKGTNKNAKNKNRVKVHPDTGTRYAGYVVTFTKAGRVIAEASTAGLKDRIKGLGKAGSTQKK